MNIGLLGNKIGMTQIFDESGKIIPVTILKVGPCVITQIKTEKIDGYKAIQIGYSNISIGRCKLNFKIRNNSSGVFELNGFINSDRDLMDRKLSILAVDVKGIKHGEGSIDIEL